jgi:hypothetical protein
MRPYYLVFRPPIFLPPYTAVGFRLSSSGLAIPLFWNFCHIHLTFVHENGESTISETLVIIYETTLRHIPEDSVLQDLCHKLKHSSSSLYKGGRRLLLANGTVDSAK